MRNFRSEEFACKCGCGINNISSEFTDMLDDARDLANTPFILNRACSCKKHNKDVGGSSTSSHISTADEECTAADIRVYTSVDRFKIVNSLMSVGFTRIGIAKTFIHVDDDPFKTPGVIWLY